MKKSQLNAISYACSQKKQQEAEKKAMELGIDKLFAYQSAFKTMRGFVNAYGTDKFEKSVCEAKTKLMSRKANLEACKCTSSAYSNCLDAIEQAQTHTHE